MNLVNSACGLDDVKRQDVAGVRGQDDLKKAR